MCVMKLDIKKRIFVQDITRATDLEFGVTRDVQISTSSHTWNYTHLVSTEMIEIQCEDIEMNRGLSASVYRL